MEFTDQQAKLSLRQRDMIVGALFNHYAKIKNHIEKTDDLTLVHFKVTEEYFMFFQDWKNRQFPNYGPFTKMLGYPVKVTSPMYIYFTVRIMHCDDRQKFRSSKKVFEWIAETLPGHRNFTLRIHNTKTDMVTDLAYYTNGEGGFYPTGL